MTYVKLPSSVTSRNAISSLASSLNCCPFVNSANLSSPSAVMTESGRGVNSSVDASSPDDEIFDVEATPGGVAYFEKM